jgi:hypothetical protein
LDRAREQARSVTPSPVPVSLIADDALTRSRHSAANAGSKAAARRATENNISAVIIRIN